MASNERAIVNNLNQRARFYSGDDAPQLTIYDVRAALAFYDRTCLQCGKSPAFSIDHVKPLSEGGQNVLENLQVLCTTHNKAKGDKEIDYRGGKVLTPDLVPELSKSNQYPTKQTYKKHNWEELQFEYVTTDISLRDLAAKHSMDASLILKRAASERWLKERENFAINLLSEVKTEAQKEGVSSRVMILEAARIALEEWKANDKPTELSDLAKILELAARVEGVELDNKTLTFKDARAQMGEQADDIQKYATETALRYYDAERDDTSTGWTD